MDGTIGFEASTPRPESPASEKRPLFSAGLAIFVALAALEGGALFLLDRLGVHDLHHLPPAAFGP